MDYLRGYKVFRADPDWRSKVMVGSLLAMSAMVIPVVGQVALTGWQALILRRAIRGDTATLPRLDFDMTYLNKLLGLGFKGFLARMVWSLPVAFVAGGLITCLYTAALIMAAQGSTTMLSCVMPVSLMVLLPLLFLVSIPANVARMRAEITGDMKAGMSFKEVMSFSRGMARELLVGSLVLGVVGSGLTTVGMLLFCVGMFPAIVLVTVAQAHFMAQVYLRWVERDGWPLPSGPDDLDMAEEARAAEVPLPSGAPPPANEPPPSDNDSL